MVKFFKIVFDFIAHLGMKYSFLKRNFLWRHCSPQWRRIKLYVTTKVFYATNTARINAIADRLADEQSKDIYWGMIKFRQSLNKKDFPLCDCEEPPQYFIKEVKFREEGEVFIDCGAFDGDTLDEFLKRCPNYKHIIAFEPDTANFHVLCQKHGGNSKITLIKAGVYNTDGEVFFIERADLSSAVSAKEASDTVRIPVKSIDNLNVDNVSFIKMDIEGSELNALKGAEKTILRDKPKLAICIYHSNEDMLCIPEYIYTLVPDYKFYVRQYGKYPYIYDTVLYALMP